MKNKKIIAQSTNKHNSFDFYVTNYPEHYVVKFMEAFLLMLPVMQQVLPYFQTISLFNKDQELTQKKSGRRGFGIEFILKLLCFMQYRGLSPKEALDLLSFHEVVRAAFDMDKYPIPSQSSIEKWQKAILNKEFCSLMFKLQTSFILNSELYIPFTEEDIMADSSFMEAPTHFHSKEVTICLRMGMNPSVMYDNPNQLSHMDFDARLAFKRGRPHFGYKLNIVAGNLSKFILDQNVTQANKHDSLCLVDLLNQSSLHFNNRTIFLDSAYNGETVLSTLNKKGIKPSIIAKACRNKPLTDEQKNKNKQISKYRCKVEHIFAHMEHTYGGLKTRGIGLKNAQGNGALFCFVYNMMHYAFCKNNIDQKVEKAIEQALQDQEQIQEEKAILRATKATQKRNLKRVILDLGLDDTSTYGNAPKALDFEKLHYTPDCSDKQDIDFSLDDIKSSSLLDFEPHTSVNVLDYELKVNYDALF